MGERFCLFQRRLGVDSVRHAVAHVKTKDHFRLLQLGSHFIALFIYSRKQRSTCTFDIFYWCLCFVILAKLKLGWMCLTFYLTELVSQQENNITWALNILPQHLVFMDFIVLLYFEYFLVIVLLTFLVIVLFILLVCSIFSSCFFRVYFSSSCVSKFVFVFQFSYLVSLPSLFW